MGEEGQSRCIYVGSNRDPFKIHPQAGVNSSCAGGVMPNARDMLENLMGIALVLKSS